MEMPGYVPFEQVAGIRGERAVPASFDGLWVRGDLSGLAQPCIAIVGTRSATPYGRALARGFARDLARAGCTILSGLALGIDACAHDGALEGGGLTIGVLGGGHDHFFPSRNRKLADAMLAAGGAVVSPFPPDQFAIPQFFLQRNGVVAALSDAVVVIEAPARSGALNTAGWAAGRIHVFAVPGDVDRPHVAGCHALIRDGAILARSAQDVLDDLGLRSAGRRVRRTRETRHKTADPLQQRLLLQMRSGECTLDELLQKCEQPAPHVLAALAMLELQGAIEARPGQRYCLR
jgi:DNA processing protein